MSTDVFDEHPGWLNIVNCAGDEWPQVARVLGAAPFAGAGKRLAWISGKDAAYFSVKLSAREGFDIRPDRSRIHFIRFSLCRQVRDCECFDLHKSPNAQISASSADSLGKHSGPSAKLNDRLLGMIHVIARPPLV
ncbi:MAG: hypothetical protein OEV92_04480 [Nitrospinota bacterium]|nr:hypothetical protein [Nitrospinota bacterium]